MVFSLLLFCFLNCCESLVCHWSQCKNTTCPVCKTHSCKSFRMYMQASAYIIRDHKCTVSTTQCWYMALQFWTQPMGLLQRHQLDLSAIFTHLNNIHCDKAECKALYLGTTNWRMAVCVLDDHENDFWVAAYTQQSLSFSTVVMWLWELMWSQNKYGGKNIEYTYGGGIMPVSCISETAARPVCSVLVSIFQKAHGKEILITQEVRQDYYNNPTNRELTNFTISNTFVFYSHQYKSPLALTKSCIYCIYLLQHDKYFLPL